MRVRVCSLVLLACSFTLSLGCGGKKGAPASVSGKVTYKGAPVTGGTIVFHTETGTYATALTPEGTYALAEVPEGECTVTVDNERLNPKHKEPTYNAKTAAPKLGGAMAPKFYGKAAAGPKAPAGSEKIVAEYSTPKDAPAADPGQFVQIPKKYASKDKTALKCTLQAGSQEKDFELTD